MPDDGSGLGTKRRTESHKGDQGDRLVLDTYLRTGSRQPLFTKGLPGSWVYAAALTFVSQARVPPLRPYGGREGFLLYRN